MKYKFMITILFPIIASSACFKNDYFETIDYWYFHNDGIRKCMEKLLIKPTETICNEENNRVFHFIKKNSPKSEWMYYNYKDSKGDEIVFKDDVMIVNNNFINGEKTTKSLTNSKAVEQCDEPPISINENQCISVKENFALQKDVIITVMKYVFLEYQRKDLYYQEVTIDSKVVDLSIELQDMEIKKIPKSITYNFTKFRKCNDYYLVNLISYAAPKASSERVFILKKVDNSFQIIKEHMLWISEVEDNRLGRRYFGRGIPNYQTIVGGLGGNEKI